MTKKDEKQPSLDDLLLEIVTGAESLEIQRETVVKKLQELYAKADKCGLNPKILRRLVKKRVSEPGSIPKDVNMTAQYMEAIQADVLESFGANGGENNETDEDENTEASEAA